MDYEELGHCATSVSQYFTGTALAGDRATLAALGSGRLELDLLNGTSRYRGEEVPGLSSLSLLRARLEQELRARNLRMQDLGAASFAAELWFGMRHDPTPLLSMDPPQAVVTCRAFTECTIHLGECRIGANWADQVEWPAERAA